MIGYVECILWLIRNAITIETKLHDKDYSIWVVTQGLRHPTHPQDSATGYGTEAGNSDYHMVDLAVESQTQIVLPYISYL